MKNFFLVIAGLLFFALSAHSQITILSSDINPVGIVAYQGHDTIPDASIQPGGTGQQTWDFSALQESYSDSLVFYEPAETPYGADFPAANIATRLDTTIYIYFEKTSGRLSLVGSHGYLEFDTLKVNTGIRFSPKQTIIRFPANLNDAYTENSRAVVQMAGTEVGVPYDSVRLVSNYTRDVKIDAYGQLITPSGTYETLRSTETEVKTDSVYIKSGPVWFPLLGFSPFTIVYSNWWTNQNGIGFPVVQIEYYPNNGKSEVNWLKEFFTPSHEKFAGLQVNVSPNPTAGLLSVALPYDFRGKMEVYDLTGRIQIVRPIQSSTEQLDLQHLVSGSYILVLKNSKGKMAGYQRFEITK